MRTMSRALIVLCLLVWFAPASALQSWTTGSTANVHTTHQYLLCLAGGGSDTGFSGAWRAMVNASGGGDVVVIRADGRRGGYESLIYHDDANMNLASVDSVTTLLFESASDADSQTTANLIRNAEMLFIAGGDQWDYVRWFKNSPVESAIEYLLYDKKVPVGGTSAGMALLGGIDYTARYTSPRPNADLVSSQDAIDYPHVNENVLDFDRTVVSPPLMDDIITETHLDRRNKERYGRTVALMAGATSQFGNLSVLDSRAIAAEEATATCVESGGRARVYGPGKVYFAQGNGGIERLQVGRSLDWWANYQAVKVSVIQGSTQGSDYFDISPWGQGTRDVQVEYWYVDRGQFGGY